ncbi:LysR substrate-binding domain protein [Bacteriovorax sp. BSW11_IV]|uniref:LysR family transcriptional regulator n=1 Tax=Bacteriovorax sp. BSW11_IV TaxID=1353529 RepID=UPI00038A2C05|nr:LysR family transcriptional regulator [Bacteriovorax sp. BSW11_IV]EQC46446.1 LysR substrate-binding domain protein [Bacteriovorax sp. BSW11_IV]
MIETSQLQTLVAVARAKSFSKAAEDLNVTQSAISQSIKNLENKIEVKLFKRSGKKVVLTPEGEKLFSLAAGFLTNLDDTLEEIQHDKDSMSGKVRIGTLIGVGKSWLAPEFLELSKNNPDLTVSVHLGFQEDLVREFENYRLDFLILPEDALPSVGEKVFLSEEKISLVFPKQHNFNIHEEMTIEELSELPTILFQEEDHLFLKWCRERYGKVPKKTIARFIVNSHGNMLQAVEQGLGVAVVPNHVLKRSYYRDRIGTLGGTFEVSNGKFYIVYHKDALELKRITETLKRLTSENNPLL